MRIVADTNTVLSGLLWHQGPPRRLINLARERAVTLCTSLTLLAELAEVIGRDKFAKRVHAATLSAAELVQDYERLAELVEPQPLPMPASRDADDDHVLACALAAQADLIVSGDHDLLTLHEYQGIPILSTTDALGRITEPGG
jgi:putative PIN family toxin of toxin-antitoxin system